MHRTPVRLAALVWFGALVALLSACAPETSISNGYVSFAPAVVDPANSLTTEAVSYAGAPKAASQDRLVVLLGGTGSSALALTDMAEKLRQGGYHVLGVAYDSAVGTLNACTDASVASDPDCHRRFRSEVVFGENVADPAGYAADHSKVSVSAADSVVSSVIKHLEYAHLRLPTRGFDDFMQMEDGSCVVESYGGCTPRWERISLVGFSQGGGVALYLSKFFPVARVGMLAAPWDVSGTAASPVVAPWIAEGGFATPPSRVGQLVHLNDSQLWRYRAVAGALDLAGPERNIATSSAPYEGSARLVSNASPLCALWDSNASHSAVAANGCADPDTYKAAWRHLAGG